jgi:hypothetical protein
MRNKVFAAIAVVSALGFVPTAVAQISSRHDGANGGAVVVGTSTTTCNGTVEGALRYNATSDVIEFCNGAAWTPVTGAAAFTFTDQGGAPTSTLMYSNTIVPTGFAGSQTVSITGDGSPQFSIAGGAWTSTNSSITSGQSLQVRLTSAATGNTQRNAVVTIGSVSDTWTVTTATQMVLYESGANVRGNFPAAHGGGRAGADAYCESVRPASLTCNATVRAFVSYSGTDEIRDFPSLYSTPTGIPVYWYNRATNTASVQVGVDWADIFNGSILNSFQSGTGVGTDYWSGASGVGALATTNCTGWSDATGVVTGRGGDRSSISSSWLDNGGNTCDSLQRVLCLCVQN